MLYCAKYGWWDLVKRMVTDSGMLPVSHWARGCVDGGAGAGGGCGGSVGAEVHGE